MNKFASLLLFLALGGIAAPTLAGNTCGDCGKITKIETVTGHRSKVGGAIIGGIAGAVVGNQIGGGDGKKVATVAGAAGGRLCRREDRREHGKDPVRGHRQDGRRPS